MDPANNASEVLPMLTILLVEDDPMARQALELGLGHLGHLVLSATCAGQVKVMVKTFGIDLIVSDHRLPDGTSKDVLRAAREIVPAIPAILMTGYLKDEQDIAEAVAEGFAACLIKPIDTARLQRAACKALGRPL